MRVSLLCIARLESLSILDWVISHKKKGIYHIYIYDNNDIGDNSLSEILKDEVNSGFVTIIDDFKGKTSCQMAAYNQFIKNHYNKNEYDWLGVIDCDEYLDFTSEEYNDASNLFSYYQENYPNASVVSVNWELYGDNHQYFYDSSRTVEERFPLPTNKLNYDNRNIKSFIKNGAFAEFKFDPHTAYPNEGDFITSDGEICSPGPFNYNYKYKFCKLKHYLTKSLEEYVYRKFGHRCGDSENKMPYTLEYYWQCNDKTPEAENALNALKEKYDLCLK